MNKRHPEQYQSQELVESLRPLGIREIAERMEVSPLLVDQGNMLQDQNVSICCTCKIPWEQLDENGQLPYPTVSPPTGSTGPIMPY